MLIERTTQSRGRASGFRKARRKGPWFQLEDDGAAGGEAVLKIYDEIDEVYGLGAAEFTAELDQIEAERIRLRINSPGGLIFDGLAIYHALRDHSAWITAQIDGVAASIASVIALAGDELIMASPASYFMIHNPTGVAIGDSDEMLRTAELLERMNGNFADLYAGRSGRPAETIRAEMAAETWFIGAEAVEAGFADMVISDGQEDQETQGLALAARFNWSGFRNAPEALRHPPQRPAREAGPPPAPETGQRLFERKRLTLARRLTVREMAP